MNSGTSYQFIKQRPNPATAGSARINAKERDKKKRQVKRAKKKKGMKEQRGNLLPQHGAIAALMGDEKQNGNMKKKRNGAGH